MTKYITVLPIVAYLIFIVIKFYKEKGLPKSISESYYWLTNKQKPLFFFALSLTAMFIMSSWIINHPFLYYKNIIIMLACSGICYTAAAAAFKDSKITNTVHMVGAYGGFILGYIFIIAYYEFDSVWFIIPSALLMGIILWVENNKTKVSYYRNLERELIKVKYESKAIFWVEMIALLTIYLATVL